jgi:GntR family transcriptional regulator
MIIFNKNEPTYIQIANHIMMRIIKEELKNGEPLDSIRKLGTDYKVTTKTIQKTIKYLDENKIVNRRQSLGVFIDTDIDFVKKKLLIQALEYSNEYIEKLLSIGYTVEEGIKLLEGEIKHD